MKPKTVARTMLEESEEIDNIEDVLKKIDLVDKKYKRLIEAKDDELITKAYEEKKLEVYREYFNMEQKTY